MHTILLGRLVSVLHVVVYVRSMHRSVASGISRPASEVLGQSVD